VDNVTSVPNSFVEVIASLLFPILTVAFIVIFIGMTMGYMSSMFNSTTSLYSTYSMPTDSPARKSAQQIIKETRAFNIPQNQKNLIILVGLAFAIAFLLFIYFS
jgi:hypothetical protein